MKSRRKILAPRIAEKMKNSSVFLRDLWWLSHYELVFLLLWKPSKLPSNANDWQGFKAGSGVRLVSFASSRFEHLWNRLQKKNTPKKQTKKKRRQGRERLYLWPRSPSKWRLEKQRPALHCSRNGSLQMMIVCKQQNHHKGISLRCCNINSNPRIGVKH